MHYACVPRKLVVQPAYCSDELGTNPQLRGNKSWHIQYIGVRHLKLKNWEDNLETTTPSRAGARKDRCIFKDFLILNINSGTISISREVFALKSKSAEFVYKTAHILGHTNVLKIRSREKVSESVKFCHTVLCEIWRAPITYKRWIEQRWRFHLHYFFLTFNSAVVGVSENPGWSYEPLTDSGFA